MTYFFGPLFRVPGGVKVEKVYSIGDFDKNTKKWFFKIFIFEFYLSGSGPKNHAKSPKSKMGPWAYFRVFTVYEFTFIRFTKKTFRNYRLNFSFKNTIFLVFNKTI
jgi:hypothetical protein